MYNKFFRKKNVQTKNLTKKDIKHKKDIKVRLNIYKKHLALASKNYPKYYNIVSFHQSKYYL